MSNDNAEPDVDPLAGIELDVEALGIGAVALLQINKKLGSLADVYAKLIKKELDYEKMGPVFVPLQGVVNVDAAQDPGYVDLGGPAYGREWLVRQLVIGGLLWSTTVAGTGLALVQANPPQAGQVPGLANVQDAFGTMPAVHFYSSSQFRIRNPQHIFVAIVGGTASTPYVVVGDAYDSPDGGVQTVATE